jgi:hypothetical protein
MNRWSCSISCRRESYQASGPVDHPVAHRCLSPYLHLRSQILLYHRRFYLHGRYTLPGADLEMSPAASSCRCFIFTCYKDYEDAH